MSGRSRNHGTSSGQSGQGSSTRQNEYFVPRDGIDREVITADICRYLGNDALVRPGNYQDDTSGRSIQGYFITAYRNLTTAMIADLKNDSARWDQERRRHQAGTVRYQDSAIHRHSQAAYNTQQSAHGYSRDPVMETQNKFSQDTTQYSNVQPGVSGTYSQGYAGQPGYSSYQTTQPTYSSPTTDSRGYMTTAQASAGIPSGYAATPIEPWMSGADLRAAPQGYDTPMVDPSVQQRSGGAAAYSSSRVPAGYAPTTQASGSGYSNYQQTSGPTAFAQPLDSMYGRASSKTQTYSPVPEPQYDDPMTGTGRPLAGAAPQTMPPPSSSRRDRGHRDDDRYVESRSDRDPRDRRDRHSEREEKSSRSKGGYSGGGYNSRH